MKESGANFFNGMQQDTDEQSVAEALCRREVFVVFAHRQNTWGFAFEKEMLFTMLVKKQKST